MKLTDCGILGGMAVMSILFGSIGFLLGKFTATKCDRCAQADIRASAIEARSSDAQGMAYKSGWDDCLEHFGIGKEEAKKLEDAYLEGYVSGLTKTK